jgi:hypothetical protein
MGEGMNDTPKDIHHAIWELLTPEERPEGLLYDSYRAMCHDEWGDQVPDPIAHRAIVDAAREVLDLAGISICPLDPDGWYFECPERGNYGSKDYLSRTEAIYHALKWLRGQKQ